MPDSIEASLPLARLVDVTVRVGPLTILDRVTVPFREGSPTALVGPNGAGKTTLLHVLMGLVEPSAGRVDGGRHRCAFVFQKPVMLRRSVADNVAFALRAAERSTLRPAIDELLSLVGLDGLQSRPARRLSGGEQQRLAIARALARAPALLLLDEATASLDPAQTKIVEELVRTIAASGVKIVFSTHDLAQARRLAGDVVLLVKGRVVEHAPTDYFFNSPSSEAARRFIAGDLVV